LMKGSVAPQTSAATIRYRYDELLLLLLVVIVLLSERRVCLVIVMCYGGTMFIQLVFGF
jgi:hypothetical protein